MGEIGMCQEPSKQVHLIPVVRRSIFKTSFHLLHEIHIKGKVVGIITGQNVNVVTAKVIQNFIMV